MRSFVPVATLAKGELLIEDMFNCGFTGSWYLQPTSTLLELVLLPRKEWQEYHLPTPLVLAPTHSHYSKWRSLWLALAVVAARKCTVATSSRAAV